jgi:hypothetical protein
MNQSRRSLLAAIGGALPLGLGAGARAAAEPDGTVPVLRFRSFEEAVRMAFAGEGRSPMDEVPDQGAILPCRRVQVGHSEAVRAGVQGCHNDRPFAGFAAGRLRIIRTGSGPGPVWRGVRLYVTTVDVVLTDGLPRGTPSRPLDFTSLPPAPTLDDPHRSMRADDHAWGRS